MREEVRHGSGAPGRAGTSPYLEAGAFSNIRTMTVLHDDSEELRRLVGDDVAPALEAVAGKLTKDVDIMVFVSPGCGACPHQVRSVAALTIAGPTVAAEIVNTAEEPELAQQYEVRAVPTTVIDDEVILVGVTGPLQLAETLLAREGPEGERSVFESWMETARFGDAADHLVFGPNPESTARVFADLWSGAEFEARTRMKRVVEAALVRNPDGLAPLGTALEAALTQDATPDDEWREDTAGLLERLRTEPDA